MLKSRSRRCLIACSPVLFAMLCSIAGAKPLCVDPKGGPWCFATIQAAVNAAHRNDVIHVAAGTYNEDVLIGIPLSLLGSGADSSTIDANGRPNGIFIDGLDHPGLNKVTIAGFTVKNALYEGVLLVSVSHVTIRNNRIIDNDQVGAVFNPALAACKGQPAFETDESGDCGGGLHLIGTTHSIVADNYLSGNGDGILISDETGESRDNLLIHNEAVDNPLECGIVLASHPPVGSSAPAFAPHYGVDHNTVSENVVSRNGVKVGGAGVGIFSDGNGSGRVSENVIIRNILTGNGIPGVSLHTHVGPAFGLPPDDLNGNIIIGNYIAGNGADTDDTATPGRAGININSGAGGTPVQGTIIAQNVIEDEDIDVAVNTPAELDLHLNDLLGRKIGVANVCTTDSAPCTGSIDATQNYWGCSKGPGSNGCSTTSGENISVLPVLSRPTSTEPKLH